MKFPKSDILVASNVHATLRRNGRIVTNREGHNVFTVTGRNWLSRLCAWHSLGGVGDSPYTNRRVRWMAVGEGTQLEVMTVPFLSAPLPYIAGEHLAPIQSVTFPTSTSVRFYKEYGANEISIGGTPRSVSEVGLFVDVFPAGTAGGEEDTPWSPGEDFTLDGSNSGNPPVAYHSFDPIPKTSDFTLEVQWEFRY